MFEYKDFGAFKQHARDFLVQTKQFADKDNADLFAEELEKQSQVRCRSGLRIQGYGSGVWPPSGGGPTGC